MRDLLTETEAATRECRAVNPVVSIVPKNEKDPAPLDDRILVVWHKCSASCCAQWRWHHAGDGTGFCGLAGLPKYL